MGALSGAASGAAAGTTISPGYGTAIGAVAGGLGGYFSDVRTKNNISRTWLTSPDGIPIVEFQYKGFDKRYRGVIAQDVIKVRPDAVFKHDGYLAVNYDKINVKLEEV
jgi:Glycine zipper/Chaperone of endosialidase